MDHKLPFAWAGATVSWNLQTLCRRCNCSKGARFMWDFTVDPPPRNMAAFVLQQVWIECWAGEWAVDSPAVLDDLVGTGRGFVQRL